MDLDVVIDACLELADMYLILRRRLEYMKKKMVIEGVKICIGGELLGIIIVLWTTFA
ncbi:MAG: hypothetical protein J7J99_06080 [Thermoprotei archaeon]|nr:hypothetical protein [Thermoprotei archaeon]